MVAQQENYKKSGFKLAYRNIRYQGKSKKYNDIDSNIIKLAVVPFEKILEYDSELFPVSRPQFLKGWLCLPESTALGYLENNKLKGFGVIRKCQTGHKIGPLFADNAETAEKLFQSLNDSLDENSIIFLDTPEVNPEAVNLAKNNGMKYVFETARMYTKDPPKLPLQKIFGVTTFELG